MLYSVCPTCSETFSDKVIPYETEKAKICANQKTTKEEKDNLISELILKLKLKDYCCRQRFLTYIDLINDIESIVYDNN
jgi:DNA-directed RNA polymerase subunit N (RpoN/RPB10)